MQLGLYLFNSLFNSHHQVPQIAKVSQSVVAERTNSRCGTILQPFGAKMARIVLISWRKGVNKFTVFEIAVNVSIVPQKQKMAIFLRYPYLKSVEGHV